jgi:uncharacterized protein YjbI with pentapeptide repeats
MSDVDGTCEYVLDPDKPETWGGEKDNECYVDDVWRCHRDAEASYRAKENEKQLCLFHAPTEQKDDEEVIGKFIEEIKKATDTATKEEQNLQFLGAEFGRFDLDTIISAIEVPVDFTYAVFDEIELTDIEFCEQTNFSGVRFSRKADFSEAKFVGEVDFRRAEFDGRVDFRKSMFYQKSVFKQTKFGGETNFWYVEFRNDIDFSDATFRSDTTFWYTEFDAATNFYEATFEKSVNFDRAKFGGDADFDRAEFKNGADFDEAVFKQEADFSEVIFRGPSDFSDVTFQGIANFWLAVFDENTDFNSVEFSREANFSRATFKEDSDFKWTDFEAKSNFDRVDFNQSSTIEFDNADLTDASFIRTNLSGAGLESSLLSRATLFDTDLRGGKLNGAVFGDVRIDGDTKFLGHSSDDDDASPHTLSAIRSSPTCVYDPDYEEDNNHEDVDKAKSVYRALEELGGKHARPRLQARSFVRRQDLQKKDYWDDATADDASFEERFIAGARWSRARVARAIMLYGESPWRIISWSLGIVLSFALLYPLGGWMKPTDGEPITYAQITSNPVEILNSVYYSTLTFTALGFGDFKPVGFGRVLTTIETALGAVLIALLVFVLGRRAAR